MSILLETRERRLHAPEAVFCGHCTHACYKCGGRMVVPNPNAPAPSQLEDGQIWLCGHCGALHEYYMAYTPGCRWAVIRLLEGVHKRESGEPTVQEFVDHA